MIGALLTSLVLVVLVVRMWLVVRVWFWRKVGFGAFVKCVESLAGCWLSGIPSLLDKVGELKSR